MAQPSRFLIGTTWIILWNLIRSLPVKYILIHKCTVEITIETRALLPQQINYKQVFLKCPGEILLGFHCIFFWGGGRSRQLILNVDAVAPVACVVIVGQIWYGLYKTLNDWCVVYRTRVTQKSTLRGPRSPLNYCGPEVQTCLDDIETLVSQGFSRQVVAFWSASGGL